MTAEHRLAMRLDARTKWILDQIAEQDGSTVAAVARRAIYRLAKAEGLEIPKELDGELPRPYPHRRAARESSD